MNKEELEKKIEDLQKQIDELKNVEIEEKQTKWKPERGEKYYCINTDSCIKFCRFDNDDFDNGCIELGNCFQNKEEAQFVVDKLKCTQKFKKYVEEHSEPIDWGNYAQGKWHICYDFDCNSIYCFYNTACKEQGVIYANSKKILEDAIAYVGEENVKKYVLGVAE